MPVTRLNSVRNRAEIQNCPCPGKKNRGTRGDSLLILASAEALSKKLPLQNRRFKWWEYVTKHEGMTPNEYKGKVWKKE